ncbi:Thiamine-monophosphate kinase [Planctomycetes bacterium Poly30]|uniref:Thiamine-monophosphate kinase n=1 Tax=Saltatorellus ferox TaxID=2528018 RepID=A0A518ETG9_9BACT|nr:Thiamine-monophosphate kinase [Planctomycetes bacterium Poly30]
MSETPTPDGSPSTWSEDRLHRWLAEQSWPATLAGSRGHDAAVLETFAGRPVLCTDQCIEGVHFELGAGGRAAGRKAVLRTLSDLAATAAVPFAVTLGVMAPRSIEGVPLEAWLRAAITGAHDAATEHGAELVAGDLAMVEGPIALAVTALGHTSSGTVPVGRDRAQPGQLVLLSGPVGGSLPSDRHLEPLPRIEAGVAIAAAGATAMMDVSDGLAWDLYRLARASGVTVRLETERIQPHPDAEDAAASSGRTPLDHGLHDGEDHELIATIAAEDWAAFRREGAASGWHVIGTVEAMDRSAGHLQLRSPEGHSAWLPGAGRGWDYGGGE